MPTIRAPCGMSRYLPVAVSYTLDRTKAFTSPGRSELTACSKMAGIPAILEQAVNSDLPGEVKALVRSNVYDTATGKYLLIPQGARMVGIYSSRVTYGQKGLQVVWTRIIYPDGTSINLDGMVGTDIKGNAGFRYDVDNHYKRL